MSCGLPLSFFSFGECEGCNSVANEKVLTLSLSLYIYMLPPPPPRYPGLGLVQMCFDRGSRQEE